MEVDEVGGLLVMVLVKCEMGEADSWEAAAGIGAGCKWARLILRFCLLGRIGPARDLRCRG